MCVQSPFSMRPIVWYLFSYGTIMSAAFGGPNFTCFNNKMHITKFKLLVTSLVKMRGRTETFVIYAWLYFIGAHDLMQFCADRSDYDVEAARDRHSVCAYNTPTTGFPASHHVKMQRNKRLTNKYINTTSSINTYFKIMIKRSIVIKDNAFAHQLKRMQEHRINA